MAEQPAPNDSRGQDDRGPGGYRRRPASRRGPIVCFNCGQAGHHKRDCPEPPSGRGGGGGGGGGGDYQRTGYKRRRSQSPGGGGGGYRGGGRGYRDQDAVDSGASEGKDTDGSLEASIRLIMVSACERDLKTGADQIESLRHALTQDLMSHRPFIAMTIFNCVKALPMKHNIYATVAALIALQDPVFGMEVLRRLHEELARAWSFHAAHDIRMLLRFAGALVNANLILPNNYIDLLTQYLGVIEHERLGRVHADFIVHTVLSALPWVGLELSSGAHAYAFNSLIDRIANYMAHRPGEAETAPLCRPFALAADGSAQETQDLLVSAWNAVRLLQNEGWKTECIYRPHLAFGDKLARGLPHRLAFSAIPAQGTAPAPIFRLRPDLAVFPLPEGMSAFDRFQLTEFISDTIISFSAVLKESVKHLLGMPLSLEYTHLVIETVFSHLLMLPTPPLPLVHYGTLIVELFKAQPRKLPPFLGATVAHLFERMESMDLELRDRLAEWFSFHLSNFGFQWPWKSWQSVLEMPVRSNRRAFVQEVLMRNVRLAYWEKIRQSIPDEFAPLMPPNPVPAFRFAELPEEERKKPENAQLVQYIELSSKLSKIIKDKDPKTPATIMPWLDENIGKRLGPEGRLALFMPTLLDAGSKSFTHILSLLERFRNVITALNVSAQAQSIIISSVAEFWQHSTLHQTILFEKLVSYRLVDARAIIDWTFMQRELWPRGHVWDIMRQAITRTLGFLADTAKTIGESKQAPGFPAPAEDEQRRQALVALQRQEKDLFVHAVVRFFAAMTQELDNGRVTPMFELLEGRFKQFARTFYRSLHVVIPTSEDVLLPPGLHYRIRTLGVMLKSPVL